MNAIRRSFLLLIMVLLALPSFAGGGSESDPDSDINESTEVSVPDPETTVQSSQSGANEDADETVLDAETAEILFRLGLMPFQNRIASEDFMLTTLGPTTGERWCS